MITGRENMQYLVYLSKTPEEAAKKKEAAKKVKKAEVEAAAAAAAEKARLNQLLASAVDKVSVDDHSRARARYCNP